MQDDRFHSSLEHVTNQAEKAVLEVPSTFNCIFVLCFMVLFLLLLFLR